MDEQSYFRVLFFLALLQKLEGCQETCSVIGLADKTVIPDRSFSTNSHNPHLWHVPSAGRLRSFIGWIAITEDDFADAYLQIDLGKVFVICALATQGGNDHRKHRRWTKEYKISTSIDNSSWTFYPNDKSPKLFSANKDMNSVVKNVLDVPVKAKIIRFTPTDYERDKILRVEVYALNKKVKSCEDVEIGVADIAVIPDSRLTASSNLDNTFNASAARLDSSYSWKPKTNNIAADFLQIDLIKVFVICAVATKGNRFKSDGSSGQEWTTKYKISTSVNNNLWIQYPSDVNPKTFIGNTDRETIVKNVLDVPVQAKLIRFIPTAFSGDKALRIEVYGQHIKVFSCRSLSVGVASDAKIPDSSMTSSTNYNSSTPASNGRLGYTGGSSWCSSSSDGSPHLQIKMDASYVICGVATQGYHNSNQWVQTYQIQTSTDESSFSDYKQNKAVKTFDGNFDSSIIVRNDMLEGAVGQFVRFIPKTKPSCMRTEVYGVNQVTVCTGVSVGLSYPSLVPDHRFSASSYYNNQDDYKPSNARLVTSKLAWAPQTPNDNDWLQIDLGSLVFICAVATQGSPTYDRYVKEYKIEVSLDNINWKYNKEHNSIKTFDGNTDHDSIVKNSLSIPVKAKFVRFYPMTWKSLPQMRVDVYGVPTTCSFPFGLEQGGVFLDDKITSSTYLDDSHKAFHGRLYGGASWCCKTSFNSEYIQIDLGEVVTVTGIATQGDPTNDKWVKTYRLKYSIDVNTWADYKADGANAKVLQGNTDKNTIVVRWLTHMITARYVKVFPKSWNGAICMRVELYGCQCPSSAAIKDYSKKDLLAQANSHVDFVCQVKEQLVQRFKFHSDDNDLTSRSNGIMRGSSFVRSILSINYTHVDDIYTSYRCYRKSSSYICTKSFLCRAKYGLQDTVADTIKITEVKVTLDSMSSSPSPSFDNITPTSVRVYWTQSTIIPSYQISYGTTQQDTKTINVPHDRTSHTINGLSVCMIYSVSITAVSKIGNAQSSSTKTFTTTSELPKVPPGEIKVVAEAAQSLKVSWKVPSGVRCPPDGYKVIYSLTKGGGGQEVFVHNFQSTFHTLINLKTWTTYYISVQAYNDKGYGPSSVAVVKRTMEEAPSKPGNVVGEVIEPIDPSGPQVKFTWHKPSSPNGIIVGYKVSLGKSEGPDVKKTLDSNTLTVSFPACGEVTYGFHVWAYNSKAEGKKGSTQIKVPTYAPGAPQELTVLKSEMDTVTLEWKAPQPFVDPVKKYTVSYSGKKEYECLCYKFSLNGKKEALSTRITITGLHAATSYTFTVTATAKCGEGKESNAVTVKIKTGAAPAPEVKKTVILSGTVVNITLWTTSSINGVIRGYQVIVNKVQSSKRKKRSIDDKKLTDYDKAKKDSLPYYIAAEIIFKDPGSAKKKMYFILGDGKQYGNYKNAKLETRVKYEVYQRALTKNSAGYVYGKKELIADGKIPASGKPTSSTSTKGPPIGAILGSVFAIIVIIAIVIIIVIIYKKRNHQTRTKNRNKNHLDTIDANDGQEMQVTSTGSSQDLVLEILPHVQTENPQGTHNGVMHQEAKAAVYGNAETLLNRSIPADMFYKYFIEKEATPGFFQNEFKDLSNGLNHRSDAAKIPSNKIKNRYANIVTYDHSRVILQDTSSGSDYVNASYINGFDGSPKVYIATQGPNLSTIEDFWRLTWQENITTIVMLTNLKENGKVKCDQYWPEQSKKHGTLTVSLHRTDVYADYVVRVFILAKDGENDIRQVHHYQYTCWPDKGVPEHATSVLGFRRKVRTQYASSSNGSPLLVHCSAGVGRTGAFLAVDAMLERIKKEKSVDIFNYVQLMRNNRTTMVQTPGQYEFIHNAVQESITCGNTEIAVLNLNIEIAKLNRQRHKDKQTGFEMQFMRLNAISPKVTNEACTVGRMKDNITRNRYQDFIPFDSGRVLLSQNDYDYINASFANTYRERNAFIMTQSPLENTVHDFWNMIYQYQAGTIVMLNRLQEENETFPQYWPAEGAKSYNGINVEVTSSKSNGPLVIRGLSITHQSDLQSIHNVVHIQHTDWPDQGAPNDQQSVLDIVDRVQKSQQQCGNAPVVVHCSDGSGRSGTFCAVYSLLERVKSEQVVDVFQAIRVLRLGRPEAVETLAQYRFCFAMVKKYLDSFNDYANFSEV